MATTLTVNPMRVSIGFNYVNSTTYGTDTVASDWNMVTKTLTMRSDFTTPLTKTERTPVANKVGRS